MVRYNKTGNYYQDERKGIGCLVFSCIIIIGIIVCVLLLGV